MHSLILWVLFSSFYSNFLQLDKTWAFLRYSKYYYRDIILEGCREKLCVELCCFYNYKTIWRHVAYDRSASASFPVQSGQFNRTLKFPYLARQEKSKVILCVRKVFLEVVFLGLWDLFSWLTFLNLFLFQWVSLFQLCTGFAPLFPPFPFTLLWFCFPNIF